jgi:hypothetical protein
VKKKVNYEVHNNRFQDELGKFKGDAVSVNNSSHKAFVERLKKQVTVDDPSSSTGDADPSEGVVCSEELMKELEVRYDEIFADIDDDI